MLTNNNNNHSSNITQPSTSTAETSNDAVSALWLTADPISNNNETNNNNNNNFDANMKIQHQLQDHQFNHLLSNPNNEMILVTPPLSVSATATTHRSDDDSSESLTGRKKGFRISFRFAVSFAAMFLVLASVLFFTLFFTSVSGDLMHDEEERAVWLKVEEVSIRFNALFSPSYEAVQSAANESRWLGDPCEYFTNNSNNGSSSSISNATNYNNTTSNNYSPALRQYLAMLVRTQFEMQSSTNAPLFCRFASQSFAIALPLSSSLTLVEFHKSNNAIYSPAAELANANDEPFDSVQFMFNPSDLSPIPIPAGNKPAPGSVFTFVNGRFWNESALVAFVRRSPPEVALNNDTFRFLHRSAPFFSRYTYGGVAFDSMNYAMGSLRFDRNTSSMPYVSCGTPLRVPKLEGILRENLIGDERSRLFLVDESIGGRVLGYSHGPTYVIVDAEDPVPKYSRQENCFKFAGKMGCFYDLHSYPEFVLLSIANLTFPINLGQHSVHQEMKMDEIVHDGVDFHVAITHVESAWPLFDFTIYYFIAEGTFSSAAQNKATVISVSLAVALLLIGWGFTFWLLGYPSKAVEEFAEKMNDPWRIAEHEKKRIAKEKERIERKKLRRKQKNNNISVDTPIETEITTVQQPEDDASKRSWIWCGLAPLEVTVLDDEFEKFRCLVDQLRGFMPLAQHQKQVAIEKQKKLNEKLERKRRAKLVDQLKKNAKNGKEIGVTSIVETENHEKQIDDEEDDEEEEEEEGETHEKVNQNENNHENNNYEVKLESQPQNEISARNHDDDTTSQQHDEGNNASGRLKKKQVSFLSAAPAAIENEASDQSDEKLQSKQLQQLQPSPNAAVNPIKKRLHLPTSPSARSSSSSPDSISFCTPAVATTTTNPVSAIIPPIPVHRSVREQLGKNLYCCICLEFPIVTYFGAKMAAMASMNPHENYSHQIRVGDNNNSKYSTFNPIEPTSSPASTTSVADAFIKTTAAVAKLCTMLEQTSGATKIEFFGDSFLCVLHLLSRVRRSRLLVRFLDVLLKYSIPHLAPILQQEQEKFVRSSSTSEKIAKNKNQESPSSSSFPPPAVAVMAGCCVGNLYHHINQLSSNEAYDLVNNNSSRPSMFFGTCVGNSTKVVAAMNQRQHFFANQKTNNSSNNNGSSNKNISGKSSAAVGEATELDELPARALLMGASRMTNEIFGDDDDDGNNNNHNDKNIFTEKEGVEKCEGSEGTGAARTTAESDTAPPTICKKSSPNEQNVAKVDNVGEVVSREDSSSFIDAEDLSDVDELEKELHKENHAEKKKQQPTRENNKKCVVAIGMVNGLSVLVHPDYRSTVGGTVKLVIDDESTNNISFDKNKTGKAKNNRLQQGRSSEMLKCLVVKAEILKLTKN